MDISSKVKNNAILQVRLATIAAIVLALALYFIGIRWLLLPVTIIELTIFLPMPRVFSSWLSRAVVGLLIVYALMQIAFLMQFITYPRGGFSLIAIIFGGLTIITVLVFGTEWQFRRYTPVSVKDILVLIPAILFTLTFSTVLFRGARMANITALAGVQVSDSVAHYAMIDNAAQDQNLNYKVNGYYPNGFENATAFNEKSILGDLNKESWKTHVLLYAFQYFFFALLMVYVMLYFGYNLLVEFGLNISNAKQAYFILATTVGASSLIMQLLLFVRDGFLNYFYICSTLLVAMIYILDREILYTANRRISYNVRSYAWPLTAYLLLGFGAGFSWTLFVPVVLLTAGLVALPEKVRPILSSWPNYIIANISVGLMALCNLASLYLQNEYLRGGAKQLFAGGALSSFNAPFLIIGLAAVFYIIIRGKVDFSHRMVAVIVPIIGLVGVLVFSHLYLLGELRYYAIKSAILLEIISLVAISVAVALWLSKTAMNKIHQYMLGTGVVLLAVVISISMMPQPLLELRNLLRDSSHLAKPPFLDSDAREIAYLGSNNKLQSFNFSVLHFDATNNRLYAQEETVNWAAAMTRAYADPAALTSNGKMTSGDCFMTQYAILSASLNDPVSQSNLISAVRDCVSIAQSARQQFYIVTDPGSVDKLRQLFGVAPVIIDS